MTAQEVLRATGRAAQAAFPDRAEALIAVVERRMWFGRRGRPEPAIPSGGDEEVRPIRAEAACEVCQRTRYDEALAVVGAGPTWASFDSARAWQVRTVSGTLRLPITICGACLSIGDEDAEHDDRALADLLRAIVAHGGESAETIAFELGQRFTDAALPAPSRAPCRGCSAPSRGSPHPAGICARCWTQARAARNR